MSKNLKNNQKDTPTPNKVKKTVQTADYKRVLAELANLRTLHNQELKAVSKYAIQPLVNDLIEVLNNLELTLSFKTSSEQTAKFIMGVKMTQQNFLKILLNYGVITIKCRLGDDFNSMEHEVIEFIPIKKKPEGHGLAAGKIAKIIQTGYKLHERVIQPTKIAIIEQTKTKQNSIPKESK